MANLTALHRGVVPPLVTPVLGGAPDVPAIRRLVASVLDAGADGLLVLGSTGEGGHLLPEEAELVVRTAAEVVAGAVPVVANVAALGTRPAAVLAQRLAAAGADALLSSPPFAFGLETAELDAHYRTLGAEIDLPLLAYQVPSRAPSSLSADLVGRLARDGVLAGVKDSSGSLDSHRAYAAATSGVPGFIRMTGSESGLVAAEKAGFGVYVPGIANVVCPLHVALVRALDAGAVEDARELDDRIERLLSLYATPEGVSAPSSRAIGALKVALELLGVIDRAGLTESMLEQPGMRQHVEAWLGGVDDAWRVRAA